MNLAEIFTKIEAGNQNPSFTRELVTLPLVNDAIQMVAKRFCCSRLETTAEIVADPTTLNYVALPDNYNHDLYLIINTIDNNEVSIRTNRAVLLRLFSKLSTHGYITDATVTEDNLYFAPAPHEDNVEQTLKIFYYCKVDEYEIGDLDEEPAWIPVDLHKGLIVDYVLKALWTLEEDGIDGKKFNTIFYEKQHDKALGSMARHTRWNPRQKPVIKRSASFI